MLLALTLGRHRDRAIDRIGVGPNPRIIGAVLASDDGEADPLVRQFQVIDPDRRQVVQPLACRQLGVDALDIEDVAMLLPSASFHDQDQVPANPETSAPLGESTRPDDQARGQRRGPGARPDE